MCQKGYLDIRQVSAVRIWSFLKIFFPSSLLEIHLANKPEMIHCPYCGEDYSSTYKHCPFCDEVEPAEDDYQTDEYDEAPRSRGGKRLVANTRGGG